MACPEVSLHFFNEVCPLPGKFGCFSLKEKASYSCVLKAKPLLGKTASLVEKGNVLARSHDHKWKWCFSRSQETPGLALALPLTKGPWGLLHHLSGLQSYLWNETVGKDGFWIKAALIPCICTPKKFLKRFWMFSFCWATKMSLQVYLQLPQNHPSNFNQGTKIISLFLQME